jgi:hypothetical protein
MQGAHDKANGSKGNASERAGSTSGAVMFPVIDRRNYPPITENADPVIRNFGARVNNRNASS